MVLLRALRDPGACRAQRTFDGCFLLNTIRKSGGHYLMSMLANYLWFAYLDGRERLDFVAMKDTIWNQVATPATERLLQATGYRRWVWEHENPAIGFNNARTIVHTYRNPLDALVSRWFYTYVNRPGQARMVSIEEALELEIPAFAWHYRAVRAIGRRPNVRRISYEALVRDPLATLAGMLEFAGVGLDEPLVERAVAAASIPNVREDERRHGLEGGNLVGAGVTSSFVRSGVVGEWRDVLGERELRRIEELLAAERISLDEFVLE